MKRVVTIQDISCIGKCSLTAALPIISAMGCETAVIPTAVLSTHTAFSDFTFRDLTDDIPGIAAHWKKEDFRFDAIYTGYLGSIRQLDIVSDLIRDFGSESTLTFVDPVLGDHGRLYTGFTPEFAAQMAKKLCAHADIIVPNLTEASFLTGMEYRSTHDRGYYRELLLRLCDLGVKTAVLTGVSYAEGLLGTAWYDAETDEFGDCFGKHIDRVYHGTGDIFASCCVGGLVRGLSLQQALELSVEFVGSCIEATSLDADAPWYGVNFETCLPGLMDRVRAADNR